TRAASRQTFPANRSTSDSEPTIRAHHRRNAALDQFLDLASDDHFVRVRHRLITFPRMSPTAAMADGRGRSKRYAASASRADGISVAFGFRARHSSNAPRASLRSLATRAMITDAV